VDVFTSLGEDFPYFTSSYPDFLDFKAQNDVFVDISATAAPLSLDHPDGPLASCSWRNRHGKRLWALGVKPALLTVGRVQPLCTIGPVCFTMSMKCHVESFSGLSNISCSLRWFGSRRMRTA
jgi:hypothetical protein